MNDFIKKFYKWSFIIFGIIILLWVLNDTNSLDNSSRFGFFLLMTPIVFLGIIYLYRKEVSNYTKQRLLPWVTSINVKKNILISVAIAFLYFGIQGNLPIGYFTLLRFVVSAVMIYLAYLAYQKSSESLLVWFFGFIAILFNPLIPIEFKKQQWVSIDYVTGIVLVLSFLFFKTREN